MEVTLKLCLPARGTSGYDMPGTAWPMTEFNSALAAGIQGCSEQKAKIVGEQGQGASRTKVQANTKQMGPEPKEPWGMLEGRS